jgi:hypothetical protein
MIAKIVIWFYIIFVLPVVIITGAGLLYGGFIEAVKYFQGHKDGHL